MKRDDITKRLIEKGLKVTPQRLVIFDCLVRLKNHPTAENIIDFIRKTNPHIATATVYKVLEALTEKGLIQKVKTDNGLMRYDAVSENHHHLYCAETDRIEDFFDADLHKMLENYFDVNGIPGFQIEDIKLQINGKFLKRND